MPTESVVNTWIQEVSKQPLTAFVYTDPLDVGKRLFKTSLAQPPSLKFVSETKLGIKTLMLANGVKIVLKKPGIQPANYRSHA